MNTKEKGDVAVGFAVAHFMSHQYKVSLPIGDKRPYDFIAEKNGELFRVQIKYAGPWKRSGPCIANLRTMGGNQSFYSAKKYDTKAFDLLFAHIQNGDNYVIPGKEISSKSSLHMECGKYQKDKV